MTKILYRIKPWDGYSFRSNYDNEAYCDSLFKEWRDSLRAALDPDGLQTHWQVSDIVKWNGYSTIARYKGRAFKVQHRANGSPSGHEWLVVITPDNYHYSLGGTTDSNSSRNILGRYWRREDNSDRINQGTGLISFHYNDTAGTTPYAMGLNLDGSHPSGDFGPPAKSPWSQIHEFMPQGKIIGLCPEHNLCLDVRRCEIALVADHDRPYIAFYATFGRMNYIRTVWLAGNFIVPYRPSDTYTQGMIWFNLAHGSTTNSTSQGEYAGFPQNQYCHTYDHNGQVVGQGLRYHNQFTINNTPLDDGKYPWDVVHLASESYYKGFLDTDILRVMGPTNEKYLSLYDGGNFIKYHAEICFPYVPNKVVFPPGE